MGSFVALPLLPAATAAATIAALAAIPAVCAEVGAVSLAVCAAADTSELPTAKFPLPPLLPPLFRALPLLLLLLLLLLADLLAAGRVADVMRGEAEPRGVELPFFALTPPLLLSGFGFTKAEAPRGLFVLLLLLLRADDEPRALFLHVVDDDAAPPPAGILRIGMATRGTRGLLIVHAHPVPLGGFPCYRSLILRSVSRPKFGCHRRNFKTISLRAYAAQSEPLKRGASWC